MQDLIMQFLQAHPQYAVVMTVIMVLRTIFKPLMAIMESGVQASGSQKAKDVLAQVEASKVYKGLAFVLDYFASIKLPVVQAALTGSSDSANVSKQ